MKKALQIILGVALAYAGISHLTTSRQEFQAQVPTLLKDYADFVVLASGVIEILLGFTLVFLWRYRIIVGWIVAGFFIAVFPGNISQYLNHVDAFGLDSDNLHSPNEKFDIFNFYKGIETIPYFHQYYAEGKK